MIFSTSYMANWRHFDGRVPVSIMARTPLYFEGRILKSAAPPKELFDEYNRSLVPQDVFFHEYYQYLKEYGIDRILHDAYELLGDVDSVVLLCTCKDRNMCHRSVFAEYVSDYAKYEVVELPNTKQGIYLPK